jgi:hypothetical protein
MIAREKLRRVEVQQGEEWAECALDQLEAGDVFRMFEPDGSPAHDGLSWRVVATPGVQVEIHPPPTTATIELVPGA